MTQPNETQQNLKDSTDLTDWLILRHAPGIGAKTYLKLLQAYGSAPSALQACRQGQCAKLPGDCLQALKNPPWEAIERDLRWQEQTDNYILSYHDPRYPKLLKEIVDAPAVLYVHGQVNRLSDAQMAIVGSRNPSALGVETCLAFARHLAAAGLTVTSGLALGIDCAAHEGALSQPLGRSIAVVGTGLDRVYPAKNRELAHKIAQTGAIVSEYPIGTGPRPAHFPQRNRIISGLSMGTLVVEAALRSGSLITAQQALEQGREVFAIPGSIHNPLAKGCHKLIKQGAKLVESAEDITEELGALAQSTLQLAEATVDISDDKVNLDQDYLELMELLGYEPTPIDKLVERSGLTVEEVSSMLLILELQDYAVLCPGGGYARAPKRGRHERKRA